MDLRQETNTKILIVCQYILYVYSLHYIQYSLYVNDICHCMERWKNVFSNVSLDQVTI